MDTSGHMRQLKRPNGLTTKQHNAIDLMIYAGLCDRGFAERVGVSRITITRWRLYDPTFQAALNQRRNEVWRDAVDGTRSLLPAALQTVAEQIAIGDQRGRLALDFLRSAGVFGRPSAGALGAHLVGPTDPDEILDQEVLRRRALNSTPPDPTGDPPITHEERDAALADLQSLAASASDD